MKLTAKGISRPALLALPAAVVAFGLGAAMEGSAQAQRPLKFREQQIATDFGVG